MEIKTLEDFDKSLEQIFAVAESSAGKDPEGKAGANILARLDAAVTDYEKGNPHAATQSRFMLTNGGAIKNMYSKLAAKIDTATSQLKAGEAINPAAVPALWKYITEWQSSAYKIRLLENGHKEALKKGAAENADPCSPSICKIKTITKCPGLAAYEQSAAAR